VISIDWDDDPTRNNLFSEPLWGNLFFSGDHLHFFCDNALPGLHLLRHIITFFLKQAESTRQKAEKRK
jgi:hypothetical protein